VGRQFVVLRAFLSRLAVICPALQKSKQKLCGYQKSGAKLRNLNRKVSLSLPSINMKDGGEYRVRGARAT
jgi:hypothetical protein